MSDIVEVHPETAEVHVPTVSQVQQLEDLLISMPETHVALTEKHHFCDGLYARELFIPAGVILTGKMHRGHHINIISQGEITVWTDQGMKRLSAPYTFVSGPGAKRAGYTHADTVWTTLHPNPTNDQNLETLELACIVSPAELKNGGVKWLGPQ